MRRVILIAATALLDIGWGLCAEDKSDWAAKLKPVTPCATAIASAQANKIALDQIDPTVDGDALNPGDSITGLVTLHQKGGRQTQWVVYMEVVTAEPKDDLEKAPKPMVLYTTGGNKFEFEPSPKMVTVRTLGPFAESGDKRKLKADDKSARFALDKGSLSLGLERAAAAVMRLKLRKEHADFAFGGTRFSEAEIAKGRKVAEAAHITADDERALCGAVPALLSYFNFAQHTPGLQDIFFKVVDMPSVWSMVRHVGVSANLRFETEQFRAADAFAWQTSENAPAYYFPMALDLNNQPALKLTLVVTTPKSPLLGCGGIVGMLAEKPGEKETYLTLRIVSAREARSPR
jgi:hypothetical protein